MARDYNSTYVMAALLLCRSAGVEPLPGQPGQRGEREVAAARHPPRPVTHQGVRPAHRVPP